MKLRKLTSFIGCTLDEYIDCVNELRSHYEWSKKVYTAESIQDVYLILAGKHICGFLECKLEDTIWELPRPIYIHLQELHIAESQQKKGIGGSVIRHLLNKGVEIELYVADENDPMRRLIEQFEGKIKHKPENVGIYRIKPPQQSNTEPVVI